MSKHTEHDYHRELASEVVHTSSERGLHAELTYVHVSAVYITNIYSLSTNM